MTASTAARTGFIGLGAMGAPMARNLHAAGLLVAVHNRTHARAVALAEELGVTAHASVAELAAVCTVVVTCVSADDDLLAVTEALAAAMAPGGVVIDCSTVAAETAEAVGAALAAADIGFVDAPVSGGTEGAIRGSLTIMAGGSADDIARAKPALEAMGGSVHHMGGVGSGQKTKAVNQVLCAGINRAVTEALAFGETLGLPMEQVVDVVGSGAGGNWFINHRGKTMLAGEFPLGFKVALHAKDLAICAAMAERSGAGLPLTEATRADYARLMEDGYGDADISALYQLQRPPKRES